MERTPTTYVIAKLLYLLKHKKYYLFFFVPSLVRSSSANIYSIIIVFCSNQNITMEWFPQYWPPLYCLHLPTNQAVSLSRPWSRRRKLSRDWIPYQWHTFYYLRPNADKYHLLLSSQDKEWNLTIENEKIKNSNQEKLLGITIDNNSSCIPHVRKICRQASKKLHVLARICTFMTQNKRKIIMKAFIESQFNYCPLVWMFHGNRWLNNAMNKIHGLRLVYSNTSSTYDELLEKDKS